MIRRTLAITLVLTTTWISMWAAAPGWAQSEPQQQPIYEQTLRRLDQLMKLFEEVRSHIDRSQFDLDALRESLDYDAEKIINFVKEEIYFEQYPGLLRGARGTLMSRAGNSLDQAVLLATLLKDAGYEARIVGATLSTDQARDLLSSLTRPRKNEPAVGDVERIRTSLAKIAQLSGLSENEVSSVLEEMFSENTANPSILELTNQETEFLIELLGSDQIQRATAQLEADLVHEAKNYFYSEYRASPSDPWIAVHPAVESSMAEDWNLKTELFLAEEIPAKLQHRFRFEVFIEQRLGEQVKVHPLFDPWEKPAANLSGVNLTYSSAPNNLTELQDQPEAAVLESARTFAPVLNRNLPKGGQMFDLDGNIIDPEAGSSPAAGVFQKVGEGFGDAAGALAEPENPEEYVALSEVWMQFTLVDPEGSEKVFRRLVVDRFSTDRRNDDDINHKQALSTEELVRSLTTEHTFMLATGGFPRAFLYDSLLSKLLHLRIPLERAIAQYHGIETPTFSQEAWKEVDLSWTGHPVLYSTFDLPLTGDETRQYRHEPSLVVHTQEMPLWEEVRETVDIVNNARRSVMVQEEKWGINPAHLVRRGVWETATEGSVLPQSRLPENALRIVERARDQRIPIKTIQPVSSDEVAGLGVSSSAQAAMRRDLQNGFTVIAPERLPAGVDTAGWWRVDMSTGQTLGMIGSGQGGETTKYIILKVIAGALLIVIATGLCMSYVAFRGRDGNNIFTCLGVSVAAVMAPYSAVLGFGLGAAIALIDIEVDFEETQSHPCPRNSICNPP